VSCQLALQFDRVGSIATGTRQMQRSRIDLQELRRSHASIVTQSWPARENISLAVAFEAPISFTYETDTPLAARRTKALPQFM
jgi:hypothetical protein